MDLGLQENLCEEDDNKTELDLERQVTEPDGECWEERSRRRVA